jgi:hypothetical protein
MHAKIREERLKQQLSRGVGLISQLQELKDEIYSADTVDSAEAIAHLDRAIEYITKMLAKINDALRNDGQHSP